MSAERAVIAAYPTVVVVAEVRLYREGLVASLSAREGLAVVGAAGDRESAMALIADLQPDVVVLDMATRGSLEIARTLRDAATRARILAFAVEESEGDIVACAEAGVAGYVSPHGSIDDLVATIERCTQGELLCSPRVAAMLLRRVSARNAPVDGPAAQPVTAREDEIIALIDEGLSNKEIAQRLNIEVATVKNHVHNILQKLSVTSRGEAAARLRRGRNASVRRRDG